MDRIIIACTLFGTRISPRFDTSNKLLLVSYSKGLEEERVIVDIENDSIRKKIDKISSLSINIFVCGMVCKYELNELMRIFPNLIWGVTGEIEIVLKNLIEKSDLSQEYLKWNPYCEEFKGNRNCRKNYQFNKRTRK